MKIKTGTYHYCRRRDSFRIYRCDHADAYGSTSSPVDGEPVYFSEEDARRRVYELNRWNFNAKKSQPHAASVPSSQN